MRTKIIYIRHLLLLFLSLFSNFTYSHTRISLNDSNEKEDYSIKVLESNATIHKVQYTIHGFTDDIVSKKDVKYHRLSMSTRTHLSNVGEPQLPTITQLIAIPDGAKYKVTVTGEKWKEIRMDNIYPAQKDFKENEPEPEFEISNGIYQQSSYVPNLVSIGEENVWRSIHNIRISICPFKYSPTKGILSVLSDFVLEICFSDVSDQSFIRNIDKIDAINRHLFANDISLFPTNAENDLRSNDYDYLIIVGNNSTILNSHALKDFQKWKALKGYKTKVVSTSTTGSTPDSIKNYIVHEHDNYNVGFVLFIGDNDKIPLKTYSDPNITNIPVESDYWYGCFYLGSSYVASIPIGRFSVNCLTDFQNMIDKIIHYESSYNGDYRNILLVAHKEDAPGKYQKCCDSIKTDFSNTLNISTAYGASSAQGGDNATNSDVINYINNGMHIVNYRGHGENRHWGIPNNGWNTQNELFEGSQVNNMNTCSLFFNVCCQTGSIDDEPCMMESLTRSPYGAIACLATTENTYTLSNDKYNYFLFKKLFENNYWLLGELNISSHADLLSNGGPSDRYTALAYICGGDPTLEIWTGIPAKFENVSIVKSNGSIIISSPSFIYGDMISVVSENGELMNKYNITGNPLNLSMPSDNFYFAVNRHNYYPYITFCSSSSCIQNKTLTGNCFYSASPLNIGYDVTTNQTYGNVVLESGAKLSIQNGYSGVLIKNGFECKLGAELSIE